MSVDAFDLIEEEKIINLDERPRAVLVGDTHGDLEASKMVWDRFEDEVASERAYLVFLGDYVDRGERSRDNIDFLLSKKEDYPEGNILLLGNHDAYHIRKLQPADFWEGLFQEDYDHYKKLMELPWMVESGSLVASHGALPFVPDLHDLRHPGEDIFEKENEFEIPIWLSVTWGDLNESISGAQMEPLTGRPQFGKETVLKYMAKHGWEVLIRAHQPRMQGWSFSGTALTIFTSQAYVDMGRARTRDVAIVDLEEEVESKDDVEVLDLDRLDSE